MNRVACRLVKTGFMFFFLLGLMLYCVPSAAGTPIGDINGDNQINLSDAILALKICARTSPPPGTPVFKEADVNEDGKIGIEEVLYLLHVISSPPLLRVSAPNGGEALTAGTWYTIAWQGSPAIPKVDILLSLDSGVTYPYTLVSGTPNDGTYTWGPVPFHNPLKLSAACRIQVRDSANPAAVFDTSDGMFSLHSPVAPMLLETLAAMNQILKNDPDGLEKDTDGDKLYDKVEFYLGTDPNHPDTDRDGYRDNHEVFGDVFDIPVPDKDVDGKIAALDNDDNNDGRNDGRDKDTDGDGIPDFLEIYGFVYESGSPNLFEPWSGDITARYYKTDPDQRSTDADQYPDGTEITGTNMDRTVTSPGNSPMIPAFPNFIVRMTGYTVTLNSQITETNGTVHESGSTWEQSVEQSSSRTKEEHWDLSTKVSASYGLTGAEVGVEVGYSYGQSTSQTKTTSTARSSGGQMSNATQWSRATSTNPAAAAEIKLNFEVSNVGTCIAKDVRITLGLLIGDRRVATMTAPDTIPLLIMAEPPKPWTDKVKLTLEELRALQTGVPVTVEVTAVSAKVVKLVGSDYVDVSEWGLYFNAAKNVSAHLFMDLGRGNTTEQLVYAGKADGSQRVTLRDALIWAANGQDSPQGPKVQFYRPDGTMGDPAPLAGWYFSLDEATRNGITNDIQSGNFNFFDTVIKPGSVIVAKAPPVGPNPMIRWGNLSPRQGTVKAYVDDYFFQNPAPPLKVYFVDKYGRENEMAWNRSGDPDRPDNHYSSVCPLNGDGTPYFKDGTEKIVARNSLIDTRDPQRRPYETAMPVSQMAYENSFRHPGVSWFEAPVYNVRDVFVRGNYAYLANGESGLLVVDINPASPDYLTTVGSCMVPTIANINRVFVSGNYAYMTDDYGQFYVVDVSDPLHPAILGSCSPGGFFSTRAIFVLGSLAYIANGDWGLVIVNIADPAHPALAGSYDTPGKANGVFVSGAYAYVADGANGLVILNVADPAHPVLAGSYDTPGDAGGVFASGVHAYVADGLNGLVILNIADPAHPALAGSYDTPGDARGVYASGGHAYVADGSGGLVIVDIADPGNPTPAGSSGTIFDAERLFVSGDHAYLTGGEFGSKKFQIVDVNPASPGFLRTGTYNTRGTASGLTVSGGHAYVADGDSGLVIVDIADPLHPVLAGSYDTPGHAYGVFVSGSHAYMADGDGGLVIVDVSDPAHPAFAGSYPGSVRGVFVSNGYAYVADSNSGLVIVNVTDPANPSHTGTYDTPGQARGVFVSGGLAYVADGANGLVIVDVSNPETPTMARSCDTPDQAYGVFVSGDYAYVADGSNGLQVVDVKPSSPGYLTIAGSCDTPGYAMGVFISGGLAYMADGSGGVQVVDVADPEHPIIAGSGGAGLYVEGVFVSGDHVYLGNYFGGLQVITFR